MQNNQTYTFRPAQSEDDERVLAFLRNFDQLETGQIDSDMEDLHFDWSEIDLARDTCIAFSPNGSMQAYSAIVP